MILTINEFISILRSAVNVQNEKDGVVDSAYLNMTDEDIALFIKLGVSRAYPQVSSLEELPSGSEYPVILLAKIELYLKLATLKADKVDMGADNNNYLKQDQRFKHYMALVEELRKEYDSYLDNEGQGVVSTYDVLLSNRHYTHRNYEKQPTPIVEFKNLYVTDSELNMSWSVFNVTHFGSYKLYVSESPIVDMYKDGATYKDKLVDEPTLVLSTTNIRNNHHKISNLKPNTTYYVAVFAVERNQVFGYAEQSFTTQSLEEEEEFSIDSLGGVK